MSVGKNDDCSRRHKLKPTNQFGSGGSGCREVIILFGVERSLIVFLNAGVTRKNAASDFQNIFDYIPYIVTSIDLTNDLIA